MEPSEPVRGGRPTVEQRAEMLKERVYITFTALAVVLALREHSESETQALVTFVIAVTGTLLAVFVADVISHLAVHAVLPDRGEVAHMARVSLGALAAMALPFVFLLLAATGRWELDGSLRAASIALVVSLVAIAWLAVRRSRLTGLQRLVVLLGEFVLGAAVVALELLVHG